MPTYSRDVTRPVAMTPERARQHIRDQVLAAVGLQLDAYRGTMDDLSRVGFGSVTIRIEIKDGLVLLAAFTPQISGKPREWAALLAQKSTAE